MRDRFGRRVTSLRLSVTTECDQRCFYCHHEGQSSSDAGMTAEDVRKLFKIAHTAGIRKLKITGGEPLMRGDIVKLTRMGADTFDEVSMTTNGVLLASYARDLKRAGLDRTNVSLDTLDPRLYESITGSDKIDDVIQGIDKALQVGLEPLKVNTVLLKGVNVSHLPQLLDFASSRGATLQLIELNPVKGNGGDRLREYFYPLREVEISFAAQATSVGRNELHDRRRYAIPFNGSTVSVEIVRSVGREKFCMNCTRIRVTSNGMLKPCLMTGDGMTDFLSPLRAGASDGELLTLFEEAIRNRRPYWVAK
ncbi:MAG: GTP 3',8-cyclase MoaA [Candidatus Thermoplasmatota archaeon]|nr:GTP 3',8-cyclase MoaA [Candidatus Thermoplasmatota archaeon]